MPTLKSLEEVKKIADSIEGFLTPAEGSLLYNLVKNIRKKGVIVEIGSWKGRSASWIHFANQLGPNNDFYCIDPHVTSKEDPNGAYEDFIKNKEKHGLNFTHIPLKSDDAALSWDKPVEFIFIDGFHRYDVVKKDFELWSSFVVDKGLIAFHDTIFWDGPRALMRELFHHPHIRIISFQQSITVCQKVKRVSLFDKLRGMFVLRLKDYFEKNCQKPSKKAQMVFKLFKLSTQL